MLADSQNHPTRIEIDDANAYWVNLGTEPNFADSEVNQIPLAGGSIVTLASNQSTISGLAVDATDVYWSTTGTSANSNADSTIMKAAIGGGSPQLVANTQAAVDLIVEGSTAYWASRGTPPGFTDGAIYSVDIGGGTPTELVADLNDPAWLAIDADNFYFVTISDYTIHKVAKTGGTPTPLHTTTPILGLYQFDQTIYFSVENKGIETISINGGPLLKYGKSLSARFMTDDGVDLFWADQSTGPPNGIIHRLALGGANVNSQFVTGQDNPWDIAVDSTTAYWVNYGSTSSADGTVMFVPK